MNTSTELAPLHPDTPRWTATLADRSQVLIRPISSQDRHAEKAFIEGLSPQARRFRFLGQVASPSAALIDQLTDVDFGHDAAFAATVPDGPRERIVGVARFCVDRGSVSCECAVTVADDWRERGLGTTLMRHLIDVARERGIRRMYSVDSAENVAMSDLARHLGFSTSIDPEDSTQYIHTLAL